MKISNLNNVLTNVKGKVFGPQTQVSRHPHDTSGAAV
jgi:isopropylmalate/homocitrate/citramalate synthase